MTPNLIHTEKAAGFLIRVYALPEIMDPRDAFEEGDPTIADITAGLCDWFVAKVTASRRGIELAADYLGACAYVDAINFIEPGGYFDDMRSLVIEEAQEALADLCECPDRRELSEMSY